MTIFQLDVDQTMLLRSKSKEASDFTIDDSEMRDRRVERNNRGINRYASRKREWGAGFIYPEVQTLLLLRLHRIPFLRPIGIVILIRLNKGSVVAAHPIKGDATSLEDGIVGWAGVVIRQTTDKSKCL